MQPDSQRGLALRIRPLNGEDELPGAAGLLGEAEAAVAALTPLDADVSR